MLKISRYGLCAVALATTLGLSARQSAHAQGPINPIKPNLQVQAITKLPVRVTPQFNQYLLATKIKLAPAVLDKSFFLRGKVPFIRLQNGEEKALIPLALMDAPEVNTDNVPADVAPFKSYILNKSLANAARTKIIKINPKIVLALSVDHRSKMSPIRDQGSRGTCVAHASNAALEAFASIPNDLSEQYSYDMFMRKEGRQPCDDGGLKTTDSAIYLADGTVTEDKWPYSSSVPPCNTTVPAAATAATKYKIKSYQLIQDGGQDGAASIKNPRYLEAVLNQGYNIVLGTHVAWGSPDAKGILDVVIDPNTNQPAASRGGHAMLICGYNAPNRYFIVKNSWGSDWGHAGYAYLSYDYIRTYAKYGYYIKTVSPNFVIMPGVITAPIRRLPN